jgi:hypothetical protein
VTYLLRQTRQSIWTDRDRGRALESFARRDTDGDGISLFEVDSPEEERLVVAAYACQKCEGPNKLDLLHLSNEEISPFGLVTVAEGEMAVHLVNRLHRVLDWSESVLENFVDSLLTRQPHVTRYKTGEVTAAVRALDPYDVAEGTHRQWVLKIQGA